MKREAGAVVAYGWLSSRRPPFGAAFSCVGGDGAVAVGDRGGVVTADGVGVEADDGSLVGGFGSEELVVGRAQV